MKHLKRQKTKMKNKSGRWQRRKKREEVGKKTEGEKEGLKGFVVVQK
jgi:hypothetical protein